jgi:Asp/Glu/Hydantoin racemase
MTLVRGGRTHYGEALGILTLDTKFPRIPGDVGNATTYRFPVRFKRVRGASSGRIISPRKGTDARLLEPFLKGARELEADGVRAITTTCGFLAIFQDEMTNALRVPVFTSSLLQVLLASRILGSKRRVGIVTADSRALTDDHLSGAGIDRSKVRIAVAGMQDSKEFAKVFLHDSDRMDVGKVRKETVGVCRRLVASYKDIGALVFEDANLPPYASAVQEATGLPVFDIVTLANLVYSSVVRDVFTGIM